MAKRKKKVDKIWDHEFKGWIRRTDCASYVKEVLGYSLSSKTFERYCYGVGNVKEANLTSVRKGCRQYVNLKELHQFIANYFNEPMKEVVP